jgi:hypothetical protein
MPKQFFKGNRNKLSADAKIASSWLPAAQRCNFFAFSLLAFLFVPSWLAISLQDGLNNAKTRTSQSGVTGQVGFYEEEFVEDRDTIIDEQPGSRFL